MEDRKPVKFAGLAAEMARYGDTLTKLSEITGVSESGLSKRMNGLISWGICEIDTICSYYQKSYEELFKE